MRGMTEQARRAKQALARAGVKRSEARVRAEQKRIRDISHPGGYYTEYGPAQITLFLRQSQIEPLIPRLVEEGFDVRTYQDRGHGGRYTMILGHNMSGKGSHRTITIGR